jgi:hypothetical protein
MNRHASIDLTATMLVQIILLSILVLFGIYIVIHGLSSLG